MKSLKKLLKEYENLNDGERKKSTSGGFGKLGHEGQVGERGIGKRELGNNDKVNARLQPTPERKLLQTTEVSIDGKGNNSFGKNLTRIGRIKRRFRRR